MAPEASADSPELAAATSVSSAGSGAFLGPDGLDLDNPHPEQACKVTVGWFRLNPQRYLENPDLKFPEGTTLIFVVSSDDYASGNGAEAFTGTIREGAGKVVHARVNAGGSGTGGVTLNMGKARLEGFWAGWYRDASHPASGRLSAVSSLCRATKPAGAPSGLALRSGPGAWVRSFRGSHLWHQTVPPAKSFIQRVK
jgi:hypothetical protein